MFWSLIVSSWLIIKGWSKVSPALFLVALMFVVILLSITQIFLVIISNLVSQSEEVIRRCKWEARLTCTMMQSDLGKKEALVLKLESDALHPIRMSYKPFFLIDREFIMRVGRNRYVLMERQFGIDFQLDIVKIRLIGDQIGTPGYNQLYPDLNLLADIEHEEIADSSVHEEVNKHDQDNYVSISNHEDIETDPVEHLFDPNYNTEKGFHE
ncbi:unnamed protein product [Orchesella dallaii]|uniref:Uncharacterized protein n=1 Tax=Orchesella dallaii TaxID=48710 RepID=A0ABP1QCW9_9HEXA